MCPSLSQQSRSEAVDHVCEECSYQLNHSDQSQHSAYLSSLAASGVGGSGSSTPSLDVKDEEVDHYDDSACLSDEHVNVSDEGVHLGVYSDDSLSTSRDRLSYPCRYCGKRFTQTGTCRRHERLHTAPNGFKCPFCQKGFNRKYRLKEHIISTHPNNVEESEISMIVNSAASSIA
ncbi:Zinc finger C2H2-type [Trinorchestia longiramus]|nr:Zinc finger C2H2-type [Trinorchestia longiramus]